MKSQPHPRQELETTRREFFKIAIGALTGIVSVAIAGPLISAVIGPSTRREAATWAKVGGVDQFVPGQPADATITVEQQDAFLRQTNLQRVWVVKLPDGSFRVYSPICPHLGCEYEWDPSTNSFACPCHNSVFDMNGKVLAGPSPRALDTLTTELRGNVLFVEWQRFRVGIPEKVPA